MDCLRLSAARQNPFPGRNQTPGKERTTQPPHPAGLVGQAKEPPAECISVGEMQEEYLLKDPFLTFLRETKYTGSYSPVPLRQAKQGDQKSLQQGGIRTLLRLRFHTELPTTPSRKDLTFLHRLAPPLKQTASSPETTHYWK